jgi:hypothetical protein
MRGLVLKEGNVAVVDFGRTDEPPLSKKQLAQHPDIRRSTRWVEMRMAEGMPAHWDGVRRTFLLSEVKSWLNSRSEGAA